ncbi:hypothetical protein DER45DRAFT_626862 [Fusarium avenaceum]|nr:hypothetical protein DER45DRAFT_626862 [Fusarium avenaceum]
MSLQSTTVLSIASLLNQKPTDTGSKIDETYWPNIRDALLKDPIQFDNLHLECGICLDEMTVFPHEHTYDPDMLQFSHRARVFPCGHMFGSKCALFMIEEDLRDDKPISCPVCRADFSWHRDCKHVHTGMPMPTSIAAIENFPPILDKGGVIADKCGDCQVVEILVGINYLAPTLLFPFEIQEGEMLCVTATTFGGNWGIAPNRPGGMNSDIVEIPMGEAMKRVCNEIKARLSDNATKTWLSLDLAGFELSVQRRRIGLDE